MLCFLMYDIAMARALITTVQFAKKKNLTPDRVCDSYTYSETYWKHEIDIIQDLIRQFERRPLDPKATFFFQAEDGIRAFCLSRGLGDVSKSQEY